jgi:hypothetical protein
MWILPPETSIEIRAFGGWRIISGGKGCDNVDQTAGNPQVRLIV